MTIPGPDPARVVLLTKRPSMQDRLNTLIGSRDIRLTSTKSQGKLYRLITSDNFDVILVDGSTGFGTAGVVTELVRNIKDKSPRSVLLLLIKPEELEIAIPALKVGTYHYARLPVKEEELLLLLEASIDRARKRGYLIRPEKRASHSRLGDIVGSSMAMQQVYKQIQQAAQTVVPILIMGETGTGKDLAAQLIHELSNRAEGPFVAVNLGALPAELIGSELFGYEKGAYTGAIAQYQGKFEQAREGTIFLDEIGTIEEKVQISLLRLIEHNRFQRLGGKRPIKNNARLIAASNQNLDELVKAHTFRQDLLFRLDVFRIVMPPLRDRQGDISLLALEFLAQYNHIHHKDIHTFSPLSLQILESYSWPGNVRELKNVVQRAVMMCDGSEIKPEHLSPRRFKKALSNQPILTIQLGDTLKEIERQVIVLTLEHTGNNRLKTAQILGISRRTLYNKLAEYQIS
ncbi:sigma-54-dependent Fis family transcriptional regulator [bacterium]|nr:sigma-54-dependent Fis family transcriptional regulator [bacterium]